MREIKFRAWISNNPISSKKDGMLYFNDARIGVQIYLDGRHEIYDKLRGYGECGTFSFPGEQVLMQYTGLKDKNGKEIYEGDVVKHTHNFGTPEAVRYEGGGFYPFCVAQWEHVPAHTDSEVIGNIYEHPNLLKDAPQP